MTKPRNSPKQLLIGAAALTVILWVIPFGAYLTLPLVYLNTHLHELCHALAAFLTGGRAHQIEVYASGSGVTLSSGGIGIVIASAGYVGASVLGGWLITAGRTARDAQKALKALAFILGVALILWIRGDLVGLLSAVLWIFLLWLAATKLNGPNAQFACQFLGVQQCLNAMQSLMVLLHINAIGGVQNDAAIAAEMIPLPPLVYAGSWAIFSLTAMYLALRKVWSASSNAPAE